jgi:MFS family permease
LGLRALALLKDPSFLAFAVCALLISIPLTFHFTWTNAFLGETDRPKPTALMTLCQCSEIVVMIVMPWFIGRIGLKNVLVVGMAAWAVRYVCFATMSFPLIILGLLMHGFCYCFVFVASFIYVSKKASAEMSASAQSLVALVMWGIGMFFGTQFSGFIGGQYPPPVTVAAAKGEETLTGQALPAWVGAEKKDGIETKVGIAPAIGRPDAKDVVIERAQQKLPENGLKVGDLTYAKADLLAALQRADTDESGAVTRQEWQVARSHNWPPIWLWPAGLAAVVCLLFLVGGRDVTPTAEGSAKPD